MLRSIQLLVVPTVFLLTMTGCGGGGQWEITAENKSDSPVSIFVATGDDGASVASTEGLGYCQPVTLIVGDIPTTLQSVKVVKGKDEQELVPGIKLYGGQRYSIVVNAEGKAEGTVAYQ